jgi:hypothetical protein
LGAQTRDPGAARRRVKNDDSVFQGG